jgi:alkylhydroperoxidase family enzyme
MSKSTLTRRALVASTAAVPAAAALGLPAAADTADAELVELGRQFEQLRPKYLAALHADNECAHRAHRLAWQRTDRTDFEQPPTSEQAKIFFASLRQAEVETGRALASDRYEALDEEIVTLARKIMNTPARSLAGLRVKAMLGIHTNSHLWKKIMCDLDWNEQGARVLIEAVCAVTGLEIPPETVAS